LQGIRRYERRKLLNPDAIGCYLLVLGKNYWKKTVIEDKSAPTVSRDYLFSNVTHGDASLFEVISHQRLSDTDSAVLAVL
jgi:hypothetical protein